MRTNAIAIGCLVFCAACSTPTKRSAEPPPSEDVSSVEINYVRGRNEHQLIASLKGGSAMARTFLDKQVLAESAIQRDKYLGFLRQAAEFLKVPRRSPDDRFPCRTPFTVRVRIGTQTQETSGCLGADEGALSHLVRDGEFLLQQGNGMRMK